MLRIRSITAVFCAAAAAAVTGYTTPSRADITSMRLSLDWNKVADAMRASKNPLLAREAPRTNAGHTSELFDQIKWLAISPHVSLVARDWGDAYHLTGGRLALTDEIRLSRSSRMVVTRVRLGDGRFAPFAHLGLGQWRVDTDLMPVYVRNTELAAQLGGGFDLRLLRNWALALECDYTVLVREQREAQSFPTPWLYGAFVASRAVF